MSLTSAPVTESDSIWVGQLEMGDDAPIVAMSGGSPQNYRMARILVRMHRAPLGHVSVPLWPEETLADRVRQEATTVLAAEIGCHAGWDASYAGAESVAAWSAQVACPRHYLSLPTAGMTVVVCTRDRTDGLRRCISTLQRVTHDPVEILVVDNAPSSSRTRDLVAALASTDTRLRYTCEPLAGLSRARNHGLMQATHDIVAFTDDDTVVDPGWPTALASGFATDQRPACVTGLVVASSLDTGSERYFDARYQWGEAFEPQCYDLAAHRHP